MENIISQEVQQILWELGIDPHLSATFETFLFTRLDTLILLNSLTNSNLNTVVESINSNTEIFEKLIYTQIITQGSMYSIYTLLLVLIGLIGFLTAILLMILVSVSWR